MIDAVERQSRTWGMLCHLTALAGLLGVPFGHLLGPLVIYLIKKDEYPFVEQQGKESLNFQLSMTIYGILAGVLVFVLIGIPLLIAVIITDVVLVIVGSVAASNGQAYRYPLTLRLIQ